MVIERFIQNIRGRVFYTSRLVGPIFFLCLLCPQVLAEAPPKPTSYVSDMAGVMDGTSKQRTEGLCQELETKTGAQLAIVIIPSLQGEPIEDYAVHLFQQWGIGQKEKSNGLLLLVAIQDRRSRLEVGYGLEPVITDAYSGDVLRAMRSFFRANQYGPGLYAAAHDLAARIAENAGVTLSAEPVVRTSKKNLRSPNSPGAGLLGLLLPLGLFFLLPILLRGARRQFYQTPPGRYYRRGRPYGGFGDFGGPGGFGGGDSGGFGGFGGGESGGGGSSSDW